jgi:hypothetical protein
LAHQLHCTIARYLVDADPAKGECHLCLNLILPMEIDQAPAFGQALQVVDRSV